MFGRSILLPDPEEAIIGIFETDHILIRHFCENLAFLKLNECADVPGVNEVAMIAVGKVTRANGLPAGMLRCSLPRLDCLMSSSTRTQRNDRRQGMQL